MKATLVTEDSRGRTRIMEITGTLVASVHGIDIMVRTVPRHCEETLLTVIDGQANTVARRTYGKQIFESGTNRPATPKAIEYFAMYDAQRALQSRAAVR